MQPGCRTGGPDVAFTQAPWTFCEVSGTHLATEHFDVYTTIDAPELIEALPLFVETAYARYASFVPPRPEASGRLTTYLFGSREEWEAFAAARYPARHDIYARIRSGGFTEGTVSAVFFKAADTTLATIAHEGWHQYVASQPVSPLPAWLNEGIATACESHAYRRGRPVFHADRNIFRLRSLEEAVTSNRLRPLDELLELDAGELLATGDPKLIQHYYAQVWALIMFLDDLDDDDLPLDGPAPVQLQATGEPRDGGTSPESSGAADPSGNDRAHLSPFERLLADLHDGTLHLHAGAASLTAAAPRDDGGAATTPTLGYGRSVFAAYFGPPGPEASRRYRSAVVEMTLLD